MYSQNAATLALNNPGDELKRKAIQMLYSFYSLAIGLPQRADTDSSIRPQEASATSLPSFKLAQAIAARLPRIRTSEVAIATSSPWDLENRLLAQKHSNFSKLLTRLKALGVVEDDEDAEVPTLYAFRATLELLYATFSELCQESPLEEDVSFPIASFATDEDRGIHIYWRNGERNVHVTIPEQESGSSYLYYSTATEYHIEKPLTPSLLSSRLTWYCNE